MVTKKEEGDMTPPWDEFPPNFFNAMKQPSDMAPEGELPLMGEQDYLLPSLPSLDSLIPLEPLLPDLNEDPYGLLLSEEPVRDPDMRMMGFGSEVGMGPMFGEVPLTIPEPTPIDKLFPGLLAWGNEHEEVDSSSSTSSTTTESTTESTTPTTTTTTTTAPTTTTTTPTTTTTTMSTTTTTPATTTTTPTTTTTTVPTTTTESTTTTTTPTTTPSTTTTTTTTTTTEAPLDADIFGMVMGVGEEGGMFLPGEGHHYESNILLTDTGMEEPDLIHLQPEEHAPVEPGFFWEEESVIGGLDTTPKSIGSLFSDMEMVTGRLEPVNNVNLQDESVDYLLGSLVEEEVLPETTTRGSVEGGLWDTPTGDPGIPRPRGSGGSYPPCQVTRSRAAT